MISVIVTAYNIDKYIEKSLLSVYNQDFNEHYNCIIVEDKSTDKTLKIIKKFIKAHNKENLSWIIIEKIENEGAGKARQTGIDKAKELNSKYTIFVDGDDTIENNALTILYNKAIEYNADVVSAGMNLIINGKIQLQLNNIYFGTILEGNNKFNLCNVLYAWLNNKLISIDIWNKTNYSPLRFIEDTPTLLRVMYYANKVVLLEDYIYNYLIRDNSLCTSADIIKKSVYGAMQVIENYLYFKEHNITDIPDNIKIKLTPFAAEHIFNQIEMNHISYKDKRLMQYYDEIKYIAQYIND